MSSPGPRPVLARVLRTGDLEPEGMAFMIGQRYLITCAHVVNAALGHDQSRADKPEQALTLDFPLLDGHPRSDATVQAWHPLMENPQTGSIEDIAILKLEQAVTEAAPAALVNPNQALQSQQLVSACGVPIGADSGEWGHALVGGPVGSGWYQLDATPDRPRIRKGYSGGPLWDQQQRQVLGMVVAELQRDDKPLSYIIPTATLRKVWPDTHCISTLTLSVEAGNALCLHAPEHLGIPPHRPPLEPLLSPDADPASLFQALFADKASATLLCPPAASDCGETSAEDNAANSPSPPTTQTLYLHCDPNAPALLDHPWHLIGQTGLLGPGWTIAPRIAAADTPALPLTLPLDQTLIIAPGQHAIDLHAGAHIAQVSVTLQTLQTHPYTLVRHLHTTDDLQTALADEQPDLIYLFGRLDADGNIDISTTPGDGTPLSLSELRQAVAAITTPPLLWLHLIAEHSQQRPDPAALQALLSVSRLLLLQQSHKPRLEISQKQTLELLDHLADHNANPNRDPALSIARHGDADTRLWFAANPVCLQAPEQTNEPSSLQRIHASLIRVTLGRRQQSQRIVGGIHSTDASILFYTVGGDAQSCPHDFPEQLRRFLENLPHRQKSPGTRVRPRWLYASLTSDAGEQPDLQAQLAGQLKQQLCIVYGRPPSDALDELSGGGPLDGETVILSLPWLIEIADDASPQAVIDWLSAWKQAVLDVIHDQVPDDCIALVGACLQWPSSTTDTGQQLLQAVNDMLDRGTRRDVAAIDLGGPLERVRAIQIEEFYALPWASERLRSAGINPQQLANWTAGDGDGRPLKATAETIHRGFRSDHEDYRHQTSPTSEPPAIRT